MKGPLLILPLVIASLLLAIWSGWVRIGWSFPISSAAAHHGALMTGSFLGTLIFLERAVTFRQKWVLLLPFVNGLSLLFFITGMPWVAQLCLAVGSAFFMLLCIWFVYKYGDLYYYVFLAGAFALLGGNLVLLKTRFYPAAVNWWMAFLLFTIVAERLELSRFLRITTQIRIALLASLTLVLASLFLPFHGVGAALFALGMGGCALWLLRYDMARRSIKVKGQHRYSAILLLFGYEWLLLTAMLAIAGWGGPFRYDALLHAFFVGFVFSMVFSHAPIIFPAVLKLPVKLYRPWLYHFFVLLQASLLVRIAGDLLQAALLRTCGGLFNGIAIILFLLSVGIILRSELIQRKRLSTL